MVYKITLSGFRAFCTVRTVKTKPINNISILWGKHHFRTLYCDEGHSCCWKGFIPFAIIVLCCFFMMSTSIFHQHMNMYMYIIALITSHVCPSCLIFIPIFSSFIFLSLKNPKTWWPFNISNLGMALLSEVFTTMILINIKLQGNFDKWFHKSRITLSPQINKLCPLSHNNIVFFLLWVLDL